MVGVNRRTRRLFTETLVGELVGISGSLLAGYGLAFMLDDLRSLPAFLVLVPAFLEMRGSISGASAARTATALHLGTITSRLEFSEELQTEIVVSTFLGIFLSAVLGVVAHFFSILLGFSSIGLIQLTVLSVVAGSVSSVIMLFAADFSSILFYRMGIDPNNVVGPYVAMLGDIVSIGSLFLGARFVLWVF